MKISRFGQSEALNKSDFVRLLNTLAGENHRLICALCWYTTERPGAILQLQVEHIYADPTKRIPRERAVIPSVIRKDKRTREVPISHDLARELRAYQPPESGYLFPGKNLEKPLTLRAYDYALRRAFGKLGWQGYSAYSTRRGSLTTLMQAGLNLRTIQAMSGHRSLSSLQRYLEVTEAEKEIAASLL